MVGQLHFAGVSRQLFGFQRSDIQEHLLSCGRNHVDRSVSYFDLRPLGMRLPPEKVGLTLRREACRAFSDDGLEPLHRILVGRTTDVPRPVIVVIREDVADFAVMVYSAGPIALIPFLVAVLLHLNQTISLVPQAQELIDVFLIRRLSTSPPIFIAKRL